MGTNSSKEEGKSGIDESKVTVSTRKITSRRHADKRHAKSNTEMDER